MQDSASQSATAVSKERPAGFAASVALCTYNGEKFIRQQLDSIAKQTVLPVQVVICDDGSTDSTLQIVRDFIKTAPFAVELRVNEHNLGVARNFDQAISACHGDMIVLSDQDDLWQPQKLERLRDMLLVNPEAGFACSDAQLIDKHSTLQQRRLWTRWDIAPNALLDLGPERTADYLLRRAHVFTGATLAISATLKPHICPIPETWFHDHWICVVSELIGRHGVATQDCLTSYRIHDGQTCGAPKSRKLFHRRKHSWAQRHARRVNRRYQLADLRTALNSRLQLAPSSTAHWNAVIDECQHEAEVAIETHSQPWWRRVTSKLVRLIGGSSQRPKQLAK